MNEIIRSTALQPAPGLADFKAAMRSLAGGVSILTVGDGADVNGMTVTSVSSFSADPPTMLVCVNRDASSYPALVRWGTFGINVVAAHQRDVAERFSGRDGIKGADRFKGASWRAGVTGVPLLVGAAAAIDCTVDEIIERHSHAIVLGRVCSVMTEADRGAFVYRDGKYVALPGLERERASMNEYLWY